MTTTTPRISMRVRRRLSMQHGRPFLPPAAYSELHVCVCVCVWFSQSTVHSPVYLDLQFSRRDDNKIAQSRLGRGRIATPGADKLIVAAHNRSTVFVGWHQCARPSNTRFLKSTPLAISDGSSIGSAVFARSMTHSPCTPHPPKVCPLPRGSST